MNGRGSNHNFGHRKATAREYITKKAGYALKIKEYIFTFLLKKTRKCMKIIGFWSTFINEGKGTKEVKWTSQWKL